MSNSSVFHPVKADDLDHLQPARLIPDTHIVAGGLSVVFGPPGTYKSFYMLDVALRAAQTGPVVYVAPEGSSGFAVRKNAWKQHHGLSAGELEFICDEVNLLDPNDVQKFALTYKALETIPLIVFDTYARCLIGGDENSAKDAGLAIRSCAYLQRRFNAAVSLVHHTNSTESRERGSTALRGAADAMIEMSAADGSVRVDCSKMKDHAPWATEHYRFLPVGESGLLVSADSLPASDALGRLERRILEFLALEIFEECGASARQIVNGIGVPESTVYKLLSRLKRNSQIRQGKRGDPYFIEPLALWFLDTERESALRAVKVNNASG
jgi:hypothetical protein